MGIRFNNTCTFCNLRILLFAFLLKWITAIVLYTKHLTVTMMCIKCRRNVFFFLNRIANFQRNSHINLKTTSHFIVDDCNMYCVWSIFVKKRTDNVLIKSNQLRLIDDSGHNHESHKLITLFHPTILNSHYYEEISRKTNVALKNIT